MPNNETVLTWTVANWITVLFMVFLGFAAINLTAAGFARVTARGRKSNAAA